MPAEAISANAYTVGTASGIVVGMSADAQVAVLQNLEPANTSDAYARHGYLYLLQREFSITSPGTAIFDSPGTAIFELTTGDTGLQIESYELISTSETVKGELIEGATVGTTGAAIPAYNVNRNESDAHNAVFTAGTSVTGGTVIAAELITADKHAASGGMSSGKIFTLKPNTDYAMKFVNRGNQTTSVLFQMLFSEKYNGYNDIWLGGAVGDAVRVRGGETIILPMIQGQTLSAVSQTDSQLGVLRQD